jgi:hypothetical protein
MITPTKEKHMKKLITNLTAHADFQSALNANEAITGTYMYKGYENERRSMESIFMDDENFSDVVFYTNPQGRLLASYNIVNRHFGKGEHHLHEITLVDSLSNGSMYAFNYTQNGIELHEMIEKSNVGWRSICKHSCDGFIDEALVMALMMDLNEAAA